MTQPNKQWLQFITQIIFIKAIIFNIISYYLKKQTKGKGNIFMMC